MEKILQNGISNEDKLSIINKYLSETINIIDNQLNPIKKKIILMTIIIKLLEISLQIKKKITQIIILN